MESEAKNIDKYLGFTISKRFDFLYENSIIKNATNELLLVVPTRFVA